MEPLPGDEFDTDQMDWSDTSDNSSRHLSNSGIHERPRSEAPECDLLVQHGNSANASKAMDFDVGARIKSQTCPPGTGGIGVLGRDEEVVVLGSVSSNSERSPKTNKWMSKNHGICTEIAALSATRSSPKAKPPCRYGRGCSHTSAFHRTKFSHPADNCGAMRQVQGRLGGAHGSISGGDGLGKNIAVVGAKSEDSLRGGRGGGFMCNECGLDFSSVAELQLHMVRKTAWSNQGLIGCRVSCLVDNWEWHEGLVTQVLHKCTDFL